MAGKKGERLLALERPVMLGLRRERPSFDSSVSLADKAQGLADATRLQLAWTLAQGHEFCVNDLSQIVERELSLVSHHLRLLARAGLVRRRRRVNRAYYSLTDDGRRLLEALTEDGASR